MFEPPAARRASEVLWPVGLSGEQLYAVVCKPAEPRPQVRTCARGAALRRCVRTHSA